MRSVRRRKMKENEFYYLFESTKINRIKPNYVHSAIKSLLVIWFLREAQRILTKLKVLSFHSPLTTQHPTFNKTPPIICINNIVQLSSMAKLCIATITNHPYVNCVLCVCEYAVRICVALLLYATNLFQSMLRIDGQAIQFC